MSQFALDPVDRRLLQALQHNARASVTELAERVGLTTSPCVRRLKRLEQAGIIRGYAVLLDQEKVGLPVSVFVSVKLETQREEALQVFEAAMRRSRQVVECYLMTGTRDYLLRVVVPDLAAFERFLKETLTRVDGVASIESSFALAQVKYANALPLDDTPSPAKR